ncbi:hypothetical protein, partial [Streptomyces sp. NPDC054865]
STPAPDPPFACGRDGEGVAGVAEFTGITVAVEPEVPVVASAAMKDQSPYYLQFIGQLGGTQSSPKAS